MSARTATKKTSTGICSFCQAELDKGKMTQHLKFCKQRAANIVGEKETATKKKSRLFTILVEGHYNPQYWMDVEIPATEPLDTLDHFLRSIWLECCGHLSAFKIGDTNYDSEPEDFFSDEYETTVESVPANGVEEGNKEEKLSAILEETFPDLREWLPPEWISELGKLNVGEEVVTFAREKLKSLPARRELYKIEDRNEWRKYYLQRNLLEWLLDIFEDRSMGARLEKALSAGTKFSYQYDFGSTTHLDLRVVAEREGIVHDKRKPVQVLARNVPPVILCQICGEPATQVTSGYYDAESNGYCSKCARKQKGEDFEMLPVVNSPRVGVCAYMG
jgi:hypothetical protein